jgi:hypothetical protein
MTTDQQEKTQYTVTVKTPGALLHERPTFELEDARGTGKRLCVGLGNAGYVVVNAQRLKNQVCDGEPDEILEYREKDGAVIEYRSSKVDLYQ